MGTGGRAARHTSRPTRQRDIARSFGGRSGFASEQLDRGGRPPEQMSRAERTLAHFQWIDSNNHFEDYADDDHFQLNRLVPSLDLVIAIGIVVFVIGGYAGFIAVLALTR